MAIDLQMRILLVEDAGTMRKMEAKILNQIGFTDIIEAVDGKDAIEKLESEQGIQLVISDWAMPNMDGYELVTWMRKDDRFKKVKFLMATGHSDKKYVIQAKEGGADGVVAKPFTPDELKSIIGEAFGEKKEVVKKDTGPKVSKEGLVNLKMAHIQITDHLALGVLKHHLDSGAQKANRFSLETVCMPSWNPVQNALENGEVDGALILAPAAMDLFSYGAQIKLVLFAHRNGSICVRNKQGKYNKPYQHFFKHKSFLIPHKMSIHNMLAHMYFSQMGLRPGVAGKEAVNVLFDVCPPVRMPEFLNQNPETCGFLVAEPIGSRAINGDIAEQLFLSSEIWDDHPCCVVVFRDDTIQKYRDAVQEFTNMLVQAGLYIRDNIVDSAKIAVSFLDPQGALGLTPDLLQKVLSDPMGITTDNLYPSIDDLDTIQKYMVNRMEIGQLIDLSQFVDTSFADVACKDVKPAARTVKTVEDTDSVEGDGVKAFDAFAADVHVSKEGKYLLFNLATERYGLGIMDVREIIGMTEIVTVPDIPNCFKGVINLRGKVIPVLDLRLKFKMEEQEYHDRTCIIIVEISGTRGSRLMGVIVDAVCEVANIKEEQVEDAPTFGGSTDSGCILGMAKLPSGVTILLDIDQIFQSANAIEFGIAA